MPDPERGVFTIMREHLHNELVRLKRLLAGVAAAVEEAVSRAVAAAAGGDALLAQSVIDNDETIDRDEVFVEEECLKILALHQPVAGDLRYIICCIKVNAELERIGDLAVNIARCALELAERNDTLPESIDFTPMEELTRRQLKLSLDALMSNDAPGAAETLRRDAEIDAFEKTIRHLAFAVMRREGARAAGCIDAIAIAGHLERIGDCATNICEDVIYLEEGRIVRHDGALQEKFD